MALQLVQSFVQFVIYFRSFSSRHVVGLYFLDVWWVVGSMSCKWSVTFRPRISLLMWDPSRAQSLPLLSILATSSTWDNGCSISLGLWWADYLGLITVQSLSIPLWHKQASMKASKADDKKGGKSLKEVSLWAMWISVGESALEGGQSTGKDLAHLRNSKEACVVPSSGGCTSWCDG